MANLQANCSLLDQLIHAAVLRAMPNFIAPLCLDLTAGNGHDSLFLGCHAPENSYLLSIDIQEKAILNTQKQLEDAAKINLLAPNLDWQCLKADHQNISQILANLAEQDQKRPLAIAMFNLGWLPNSDKAIITTAKTTCYTLNSLLDYIAPKGIITIHAYTGHSGASQELEAIFNLTQNLDSNIWRVFYGHDLNREYQPENSAESSSKKKKHKEAIFIIERLVSKIKKIN